MTAPSALLSSESEEWFTPEPIPTLARRVMGWISLDPASCEEANGLIRAYRYFTKQDDGLLLPWGSADNPENVFLNPPYGKLTGVDLVGHAAVWARRYRSRSNQMLWTRKAVYEYRVGHLRAAILLVNAAIGSKWFTPLFDYPICFPDERLNFIAPEAAEQDRDQPTHGQAIIYLGKRRDAFVYHFSAIGIVVERAVTTYRGFEL